MARTADPQRRQVLLGQIVEYLLDQPLATLSFRTLASALGVSTYTLVYQFGSRAKLLHEIVRAIADFQSVIVEMVAAGGGDLDAHLRQLRESWRWFLQPRNRQLQRLEFEASMLEAQNPGNAPIAPEVFRLWHKAVHDTLCAMGIAVTDADLESRIVTSTIYGLRHDLIVNGNESATTAAFERMLLSYSERVRQLISRHDNGVRSLVEGAV